MKSNNDKFLVTITTRLMDFEYVTHSLNRCHTEAEAIARGFRGVFRSDSKDMEVHMDRGNSLAYEDIVTGEWHELVEVVRLSNEEYQTLAKFI
tara:strand:- start:614 stop:892 length:279 start_codon:yes stop_codon:yes gene_type:complete